MIVSVSRRTDIPAFYSEWFINRIKEGFVYVKNPMNPKQISKVKLTPDTVDCFVFWTKNAKPMLKYLDELKDFKYYFQFTITGYNADVEKRITNKREIIETFKELSNKIGKNKVILRYDPIFINNKYTIDYHVKVFDKLCSLLDGYTNRCVISFIDLYKKTEINTKHLNITDMTIDDMNLLAEKFSKIANEHNIKIETCSEKYDLTSYGIEHGKCIDDKIISDIIGYEVIANKDENQRETCGCIKSIDIGQYNTCIHNCLYCYANFNDKQVKNNLKLYDKKSPLLIGNIDEGDKITDRKMKSIKGNKLDIKQITLEMKG